MCVPKYIVSSFAAKKMFASALQDASLLARRSTAFTSAVGRTHHSAVAQHCRNLRTVPAALALRSVNNTKSNFWWLKNYAIAPTPSARRADHALARMARRRRRRHLQSGGL